MNGNLIKEYEFLRNEIDQKIELHNNLLTFTITTAVAVLTFALSKNQALLYLMPFCIIIPMSMRIAYYRSAISKLSAYLIVFLEKELDGINWETRNVMLLESEEKNKKRRIHSFTIIRYYECLILIVICYGGYVVNYIKDKEISIMTVIGILWPLLFVAVEVMITKDLQLFNKEKRGWIEKWNDLKEKSDN